MLMDVGSRFLFKTRGQPKEGHKNRDQKVSQKGGPKLSSVRPDPKGLGR